jgi:hypothetical protein
MGVVSIGAQTLTKDVNLHFQLLQLRPSRRAQGRDFNEMPELALSP